MTKIKAILFDLGNTLAIYPDHFEQIQDVIAGHKAFVVALLEMCEIEDIEEHGQIFNEFINHKFSQRLQTNIETPLPELIELYTSTYFDFTPNAEQMQQLVTAYFSTTEHKWEPAQQLEKVLFTLKQNGYQLGILSNACSDTNVQNMVDDLGIRHHFDFVISSSSLCVRKPANQAFEASISNWIVDPQEVLMVGDTLSQDIIGANQLNIPTVWISYGATNNDTQTQPTHTINQLSELLSILSL